ncbi:putative NT-type C2 domain-containing protein [Helianthus anomalus]
MFKPVRWRSEKNKIKGVFRLQFHATQLAQFEGDALMISMIPADVGKPTSKLEKVKVRDGSCHWEKPLFETVKFSQDPKTGRYNEKIYHITVAKDSSRFGSVGEVSIDFASYAEATKLSSLSLPLKNANSAAVLHVSIQRVQGTSDQRDVDGIANDDHHDRSLRSHFGNGDLEENSDTGSGLNTPREREPKNAKLTHESSITKDKSSQWDWLNGSDPKVSTDDSSTSTLGETSEESSPDAMIQNLKVKVAALTKQANVSELELQTLRKQIVKEMKKNQELSREVATLKEERNMLKDECEKLKAEEVKVNGMLLIDQGNPWALLDELRQDLNHEKDISSNLRLQLQETLESNAELVLALEMTKSKSELKSRPKSKSVCSKSEMDDDEEQRELEAIVKEHNGAKETYLLEQKMIELSAELELYKREKDELEMHMEQLALDYEIMKQENHDLSFKLERSQLQEQLKMQYECTSSYATVTELETQIESIEDDLKSKSKELSKSNLVIKELEFYIKNLEEVLKNQAHEIETDFKELMRSKIEQEQRAIRAEDDLRKMKLQNVSAATRLQDELRRLSQKMASTFEVNEKAAVNATNEANKLRVEKQVLEDTLVKVTRDLQDLGDRCHEKLVFLQDQITLKLIQLEKIQKQVENMTEIHNLESERLKELATDCSENFVLCKEKDLQLEIEELERKLDVLVQKTKNSQ